MNITPTDNNVSMQGKGNPNWFTRQVKSVRQKIRRVEQKVFDKLPSHTTKESTDSKQKWDKTSHWFGHPMWNRGVMGATALLTQPAIDYYNHRVDDETRTVSRNRTIAKIIAGTLVGMFVVRGPVHKFVKKYANPAGKGKWDKILLPKIYLEELTKNENALKNYQASISMAIALGLMSITNFVLDAPLTVVLTNYFNRKSGVKIPEESNKRPGLGNTYHTDTFSRGQEVKNA